MNLCNGCDVVASVDKNNKLEPDSQAWCIVALTITENYADKLTLYNVTTSVQHTV